MLSKLFAPLAMKVSGGIIAALLLAVAIQTVRVNSAATARDNAIEARQVAELSHRITATSLAALEDELEGFVEAGELRQENLDTALAEVAEETAALREQAENFDIETAEGL